MSEKKQEYDDIISNRCKSTPFFVVLLWRMYYDISLLENGKKVLLVEGQRCYFVHKLYEAMKRRKKNSTYS